MTTRTKKTEVPPVKVSGSKAARVARIVELRAQAKACYQEAEAIESGLMDRMSVGDRVNLPDGRVAQLVDNFAEKNIVWCHASSRRFEIKVV